MCSVAWPCHSPSYQPHWTLSELLSLAVPNLGLQGLKAIDNSKYFFINISKLYTQGYFRTILNKFTLSIIAYLLRVKMLIGLCEDTYKGHKPYPTFTCSISHLCLATASLSHLQHAGCRAALGLLGIFRKPSCCIALTSTVHSTFVSNR